MSQGLITLTNGSAAVSGAGTNFGTDNKIGDFIVGYINGQSYSLAIASIESPTALTLTEVFYGPTTASVPWDSVPLRAITAIPYQLGVQHLKTLRLMNLESDNWLQMYTSPGDITVNLPDDRQYRGPSILKIGNSLSDKANKGANSDITSLSGLTTALSVAQGGTGAKDATGVRTNLGISDKQLNSVDGKSGGTISSPVSVPSLSIVTGTSGYSEFSFKFPGTLEILSYLFTENLGDMVFVTKQAARPGTEKYFALRNNGNMTTQGNITCVSLTQTSDAEKKDNIEAIDGALSKIERIRGVTYQMKDSGMPSAGVIAQELIEVLPDAVGMVFDDYDRYEDVTEQGDDGEEVTVKKLVHKRDDSKRSYTVEYSGVVALCVEAIKELSETVKHQSKRIEQLEALLAKN